MAFNQECRWNTGSKSLLAYLPIEAAHNDKETKNIQISW